MKIKDRSISGNKPPFIIAEISANLMVSETIWNYDPEKGKLGSHSISVSDFY